MNAARQISRRFDRATRTQTRFAADYSITATISVVPDPLEAGRWTLMALGEVDYGLMESCTAGQMWEK